MGRGVNCKLLVMRGHPCKLTQSLPLLQTGLGSRFFSETSSKLLLLAGVGGKGGTKKEHDPISGYLETGEQMGGSELQGLPGSTHRRSCPGSGGRGAAGVRAPQSLSLGRGRPCPPWHPE